MRIHIKQIFKNIILRYRRIIVAFVYVYLILSSYAISYLLRFDFFIPEKYLSVFLKTLPLLLTIKLSIYLYFGLFYGLWRYASIIDLWGILKANVVSTAFFIASSMLFFGRHSFPRSVFVIDFTLCILFTGGIRFLRRILKDQKRNIPSQIRKKVLIIGAGNAGILVLKEYYNNPKSGDVIGFIDDDSQKYNEIIYGKKVLGKTKDIDRIATRYNIEEIILAIPSLKGDAIRRIISYCKIPNVKLKIIPSFQKILNGDVEIKPREVKPEDLLGREIVTIDESEINNYISNKIILVTGAGGSIGSELCRQIAHFSPHELILFDHNENNLYYLITEFKIKYPSLRTRNIVGDIKDISILKRTFSNYRPNIVYHAAAHKHVPLMEENPASAVKNNIIGSRNLIYAANHYSVERFILISTDKAVKPVSVMGMSKRIAELILQTKVKNSKTKFMVVRFGNVIGSDGSVVPLFKRQIENGGPITITHPEVTRYFMSIKEAVLLVLQAAAFGNGGEIFTLNMGEQIKIVDLAKNMITLSGLVLDEDIKLSYIGLRPGEKLSEELLLDAEKDIITKHNKIFMSDSRCDIDRLKLFRQVKTLEKLAVLMNETDILKEMKGIIAQSGM